jgi:hypothetical protein
MNYFTPEQQAKLTAKYNNGELPPEGIKAYEQAVQEGHINIPKVNAPKLEYYRPQDTDQAPRSNINRAVAGDLGLQEQANAYEGFNDDGAITRYFKNNEKKSIEQKNIPYGKGVYDTQTNEYVRPIGSPQEESELRETTQILKNKSPLFASDKDFDPNFAASVYGIERGLGNVVRGVKRLVGIDKSASVESPFTPEQQKKLTAQYNAKTLPPEGVKAYEQAVQEGLISNGNDIKAKREEFDKINKSYGAAGAGELVGEALPLAPLAVAGGWIPAVGARLATLATVGAADLGLSSAGRGDTGGQIALNTALGGLLGPAGELAAPVVKKIAPIISKYAEKFFTKVTGIKPKSPLIDEAGAASPQLDEVLKAEGKTIDDLINDIPDDEFLNGEFIQATKKTEAPATNQGKSVPAGEINNPAGNFTPKSRDELVSDIRKGNVRNVAEQINPDIETKAAAERLGIEVNPSVYSKNQTYREVEQGLASLPASDLNRINVEQVQNLSKKADELIEQFGGTLDKTEFNATFRKHTDDVIDDLEKKASAMYKEIKEKIPVNTRVNTDNLKAHLEKQIAAFGDESALPALEKKLYNAIKQGPVTYHNMDHIRKEIGRALRKEGEDVFKNADKYELSNLYDLLTKDQELVAEHFKQLGLFKAAKGLVSQRKQIELDLKSVLGKKLEGDIIPKLSASLKDLSSKGSIKNFEDTVKIIPPNMKQQAVLSALTDVFSGSKNKTDLSIAGFSNWFNGLKRNKEALKVFKENLDPEAFKVLSDIAQVTNGIAQAQKAYITTGKSRVVQTSFGDIESKAAKIFKVGAEVGANLATGGLASLPIGVIRKARGVPKSTMQKASELFTSKKFKDMENALYTQGEAAAKRESSILTKTKVFLDWYNLQDTSTKKAIANKGFFTWLNETTKEEE